MIELLVQAELGRRIGQRQTFISKVKLGERRLDVAEFVEICRAIDVDPCALMRRAESEKLGAKANARDHSELGLSRIRNADAIASFDDFEGDD